VNILHVTFLAVTGIALAGCDVSEAPSTPDTAAAPESGVTREAVTAPQDEAPRRTHARAGCNPEPAGT
jgi:hypothetical protein